jgi:hypothetical protein
VLDALTAADARRWAVLTRAAFAARRAEIDALNVYPVPDGDTGTNLYLTLDAALDAVRSEHERLGMRGETTLEQECEALARCMLLTARGNSGVILSQLVRGFAEAIAEAKAETADGRVIADGMVRANERAWGSVTRPSEGTILSVARAAAEAGTAVSDRGLAAVSDAALEAATAALARTTSQLPVLERAGVVDAGAAGYLLLLEALHRVVHEDEGRDEDRRDPLTELPGRALREGWTHVGGAVEAAGEEGAPIRGRPTAQPAGPAYEVMYLLADSDEARVDALRGTLDRLGDSLLVVGGPELWNVHVHVDDAGAAIEAGITAGRPFRIRVTHFEGHPGLGPASGVAVVACAAGPGLRALFEEAGAHVVDSGPGGRASAGQILGAARAAHALSVIVLPNDGDTQMAAEAAASAAAQEGIELYVVASRSAVQGVAALAVFDPDEEAARNASAMSGAAAATRHGAVAIASKEAVTDAGPCRPGDVLGVVGGEIVEVGSDVEDVAVDVMRRLLADGGELVTVIAGEGAGNGSAEGVGERIREGHRDLEVTVLHGGQPHYPLLLGVE